MDFAGLKDKVLIRRETSESSPTLLSIFGVGKNLPIVYLISKAKDTRITHEILDDSLLKKYAKQSNINFESLNEPKLDEDEKKYFILIQKFIRLNNYGNKEDPSELSENEGNKIRPDGIENNPNTYLAK